jgi:hypothetical protein
MVTSTTPPSYFDDCLSTMLSCSPALPKIHSLTPGSLHRPHSSSVSSDSTGDTNMASFQNDDLSQQMYFFDSSPAPFYPLSVSSPLGVLSFNAAEAYTNYDQPQWISVSGYSQPPSMVSYADAPSSIFPTLDGQPISSGVGFMPPLPQSISESNTFDFNIAPLRTLQSQGILAASPALSQARSDCQTGSIPSLSRSCSPNPSLFSGSIPVRSTLSTSTAMSPRSNNTLGAYGILITSPDSTSAPAAPQTWRCAYPGCTSRAVFTRGCDLRKHYNRHSKHLFCRVDGCPQSAPRGMDKSRRGSVSASGGFSSKKDRARHEAKHNPGIRCEWQGADGEECGRVFSRMDNMKDHVRRIHGKGSR